MNGRPNCRNKVAFLNSWVSVKSVYEELRFRDGLAWTVGLTVEIKLRFFPRSVNGLNTEFIIPGT